MSMAIFTSHGLWLGICMGRGAFISLKSPGIGPNFSGSDLLKVKRVQCRQSGVLPGSAAGLAGKGLGRRSVCLYCV